MKGTCPDCKQSDVMIVKAVSPRVASEETLLNIKSLVVKLGRSIRPDSAVISKLQSDSRYVVAAGVHREMFE